jgi:hypothetical protein
LLEPSFLLSTISVIALAALISAGVWALSVAWRRRELRADSVWLLAAYVGLVVFVIWWDPFEPKWFVVPNLFVAVTLAMAWGRSPRPSLTYWLVAPSVVLMALATFVTTVWPNHAREPAVVRQATCIGEHLSGQDVFIAIDWKWNAYLHYLHDCRVVSLLGSPLAARD